MTASDGRSARRAFLFGAGLLLALLAARIFMPFMGALLAAASLAVLLAPLHHALAARALKHPSAVAAAVTAAVTVLLAVPLVLGGTVLIQEATRAYPAARNWIEHTSGTTAPATGAPQPWAGLLADARERVASSALDPKTVVLDNLDQVGARTAQLARAIVKNAVFVFLNLTVFTAALFLFLRDGKMMVASGMAYIPLPEERKTKLQARVRGVLLAVVNGIFAVALLQGLLAWAGLAFLGVPFPFLLGALCMLLSPIPFVGSAVIWAPVVFSLLLTGETARALTLALWFIFIVGLSDNLVRPVLVGTQMKLPIPLVFIGVIGALTVFGLAGLFIGPLVIALGLGFLDAVRTEREESEAASARADD